MTNFAILSQDFRPRHQLTGVEVAHGDAPSGQQLHQECPDAEPQLEETKTKARQVMERTQ